MRKFRIATAGVVLGALALVAGSGAYAGPSSQASRSANANIVQTAVAAGQFTTLVSLVKKAGLASTLSRKGPFTVFAPTDAAFAKVPKSTLAALAKDRAALRNVLLYHVAAGKVPSTKVVDVKSVKTLNGQSAPVRVRNGAVFVGGARVTAADVKASNGVIHIVNKVLLPSS